MFNKVQRRGWSDHYPQSRRLLALSQAAMQHATPASVVGDRIAEIVNTGDATLRHPVGPDAGGFLAWRASMTDEQWIAWNSVESDQEWARNVKRDLGIDVQLS